MNAVISQIVDDVSKVEAEEKQMRLEKYQELLNAARAELRKVLDQVEGLYDELKPFIQEENDLKRDFGRQSVVVSWLVQSDQLELCPLKLLIEMPGGGHNTRAIRVGGYGFEFPRLKEAITIARREFPDWKKKDDEDFASRRTRQFNFWGQRDEQKMQSAYEELVARFPDRKAEFDQRAEEWRAERAKYFSDVKAREEDEQKHVLAKTELLEQWVSFYKQEKVAIEANRAKAELLQADLDQPFTAWSLEYGAVGEEEGQRYVETYHVWVRDDQTDSEGLYTTFSNAKVRYFHLVSISPKTIKPTDKISGLYKSKNYKAYGIWLVCSVDHESSKLDELVESAGFEPLPKPPQHVDILSYREEEEAKREAFRSLNGDVAQYDDEPVW